MTKTDSTTTLAEIKQWCEKVRTERGWHPNAKDLAISMSLEMAELLEHFQWGSSEELEEEIKNNPKKKKELELELGDVVNYMCEFAERMDIDISHALYETLEKVKKKYPAKETKTGGDEFYNAQKRKYRKAD